MKELLLSKITDKINKRDEVFDDDSINFTSSGYKSQKLTKKNFHIIRAEASEKKIGFIDGGQTCIFSAPDFSFHLIRVFGHIMQRNKTVKSLKSEFYVLVSANGVDEEVYYKTEVFPITGSAPENITIDSMDNRIKEGVDRGNIIKVCDILRRSVEIEHAINLLGSLKSGDFLVLDGTLEARFQIEEDKLKSLYESGVKNEILISALSKSTNLLTMRGRTFITVLKKIAPEGIWYYHPVVGIKTKSHQAEIYFVKLNKKSNFIFRFEIYKEQNLADIGKVTGILASQAKDLLLPGYPYGLMKADKFARVSESEKEYLKTKFLSKLSKSTQHAIRINDVHDILDSIY